MSPGAESWQTVRVLEPSPMEQSGSRKDVEPDPRATLAPAPYLGAAPAPNRHADPAPWRTVHARIGDRGRGFMGYRIREPQ